MRTLFAIALWALTQATFTSRTVVVVVPVTVTDDAGRVVAGLTRDRFRVFDEGREQVITTFEYGESPVTLGLVVDASASMRPKLGPLTDAMDAFARTARTDDELFLVSFNERVTRADFAAGLFTRDPADLRTAFTKVRPFGTTALWDATRAALDHVRLGSFPKKALVIVSDGGDNASRATFEEVLSHARAIGALIYTIGLSADPQDRRSNRELARLATESGGTSHLPGTPDQIGLALSAITRDLRQQYVLGFTPPTSAATGEFRRVRVTVDDPARRGLTIRSRSGYSLAPGRQ